MAKWETKLNTILKEERNKHEDIWVLCKVLEETIHGFSPIDNTLLEAKVRNICDNTVLLDSEISSVAVSNNRKDKEDGNASIEINIKGAFSGKILLETWSGWRDSEEGKIDIYYVPSLSKPKIHSNKAQRIEDVYSSYKKTSVDTLIDTALDGKHYVKYNDEYSSYEIWDTKRPSWNEDKIEGRLNVRDYRRRKTILKNLQLLRECGDLKEFAEEYLYSREEEHIESGIRVELVRGTYMQPDDMLESFDFTVTQFAYYKDYEEDEEGDEVARWKIMYHNRFFEHLFMKRLVVDKDALDLTFPFSTYNRMFKYGEYGYFPCRETKVKVVQAMLEAPEFDEDMIAMGLYRGLD